MLDTRSLKPSFPIADRFNSGNLFAMTCKGIINMAEERKDLSLFPQEIAGPAFRLDPYTHGEELPSGHLKDILIGLVITYKKTFCTSSPAHQLHERYPLVGRFLGQQVLDILPADYPRLRDQPANGVKHTRSGYRPVPSTAIVDRHRHALVFDHNA